MSERDVFIAMLEAAENKSKEVKPGCGQDVNINLNDKNSKFVK